MVDLTGPVSDPAFNTMVLLCARGVKVSYFSDTEVVHANCYSRNSTCMHPSPAIGYGNGGGPFVS